MSAETDSYSETAQRLGLDPRTARDRVDPAWLAPLEHAVHADHVAYEPGPGRQRLRLPLVNVLGRPVLPPREITWMFDVEFGTLAAQLDLVRFLDGREGAGVAVEGDVETFRRSWHRPKWPAATEQDGLSANQP